MADQEDSTVTCFQESGAIARPGPLGRFVRLVLGLLCAWAVWGIIIQAETFWDDGLPLRISWVVLVALAYYTLPSVFNIGFTVNWKRWPQWIIIVITVITTLVGWIVYHNPLGPPLGILVFAFTLYFYTHLGVSFILSALLATPGCEMRAIPHLISKVSGKESPEHACPGFLTKVDEWEQRVHSNIKVQE